MWKYDQRSGEFIDGTGKVLAIGYSGRGAFRNDPAAQCLRDQGPLPRGTYKMLAAVNHPHLGRQVIALVPDPANVMCGRSGFFIHGDSIAAPGTASEGCIILSLAARECIDRSDDKVLLVESRDLFTIRGIYQMNNLILSALPEINPLEDFKLTFDHFYQFVKLQAGAEASQLIQIRAAAEPIDFSVDTPWFSYYSYLIKMDTRIVPVPITEKATPETFGLADGQLSYEYGRLLSELVRMVELKELPTATNQQIATLQQRIENLNAEADQLIELDAARWTKYANAMGFNTGDRNAYTQWWLKFGHAQRMDMLREGLEDANTQIAILRLDKFADADQEQIFEAFKQFSSVGSRLRWPRIPDTRYGGYENTPPFTPDYLARLPTGDSALFADRRYMFIQGIGLSTLVSTNLGHFDEALTSSSSSSSSITTDWGASGSASYGWFSVSANASEHKEIKEDMKNTKTVKVSCQSLLKLPYDAKPWFNPEIFTNSYVIKNAQKLTRYFGANGTLRYYPIALLVARGMKIEFESTADYHYDYKRSFSASGGGSARFFGIGIGGSANYSENRQEQNIEANGHRLTLDDGDKNFRVIGYVVSKVAGFDKSIFGALSDSLTQAASLDGAIGVGGFSAAGEPAPRRGAGAARRPRQRSK